MSKEEVEILDRVVAININQTYRAGLSAEELYDVTRGIWRLDRDRAENAKYAFAVYQGEIKEVYFIQKWHRAGTTQYETPRELPPELLSTRFEFTGIRAPDEIRDKYVGKLLAERHAQNPIKYFKC